MKNGGEILVGATCHRLMGHGSHSDFPPEAYSGSDSTPLSHHVSACGGSDGVVFVGHLDFLLLSLLLLA